MPRLELPPVRSYQALCAEARLSRAAGVVLGAAVGDALGHPTEFLSLAAIRERFGPAGVRGYELYWERDGQRFAPYTDDTQMAELVLRSCIWQAQTGASLDETMRVLAAGFVRWAEHPQGGHRAPGNACLAGCAALAAGAPWREAGGARAGGCGSVMRAYPYGIVFADDIERAELWSVEHSKLTHRDPIALGASAALAVGVARLIQGATPSQAAGDMVAAASRYSEQTAAMLREAISDAETGVASAVTLDRLRAWAAHEAICAGLFIFLRHPTDGRAALLEGANTEGDSDSIATLAGALVGAHAGLSALPEQWVCEVERSEILRQLAMLTQAAG